MLGNNAMGHSVVVMRSWISHIRFLCAERGAGLGVLDDVRWVDSTRCRWSGCGHLVMLGRPESLIYGVQGPWEQREARLEALFWHHANLLCCSRLM